MSRPVRQRFQPEASFRAVLTDDHAYNAPRDCPDANCVVAKIDQFVKVLRDHSALPAHRPEAQKFVVHFVGTCTSRSMSATTTTGAKTISL